jgi:type I restriction enzyme M protein
MSATSCGTRSQGISGDAQRLEQFGWMLFLKIMDDKDQGLEPTREGCQSESPVKF